MFKTTETCADGSDSHKFLTKSIALTWTFSSMFFQMDERMHEWNERKLFDFFCEIVFDSFCFRQFTFARSCTMWQWKRRQTPLQTWWKLNNWREIGKKPSKPSHGTTTQKRIIHTPEGMSAALLESNHSIECSIKRASERSIERSI